MFSIAVGPLPPSWPRTAVASCSSTSTRRCSRSCWRRSTSTGWATACPRWRSTSRSRTRNSTGSVQLLERKKGWLPSQGFWRDTELNAGQYREKRTLFWWQLKSTRFPPDQVIFKMHILHPAHRQLQAMNERCASFWTQLTQTDRFSPLTLLSSSCPPISPERITSARSR